jgi:hypothetical protein
MKSKMAVSSADADCKTDENTKLFCGMNDVENPNDNRNNGGCEGGVLNPVKPTKYAGSPD